MTMSKRGICYHLPDSPYQIKVSYDGQMVTFFFSSSLNVEKFYERCAGNREAISASLSSRFKFIIKNDILCDIVLYEKIENRGFYIDVDGKGYSWLEEVELNGVKVTSKN